ncbi:hypothetical protein A2961_03565 [Candidatus Woesebacteria bacterium RIFCSPLOWO2_01_FULL_39_21]|mgnify:CR=1 FL=1|uniref:PIN domain-containing protein n=1 Tax=Candidatus Woesebacteria bacterium RIFCSPLOWO2_01_FULL_39_21 TaxID=1802519 RepID=A0A1F8BJF3_9BACT|nr:MAG: hypothetical protein A2691_01265 [Candidatus Woesebacteria bacterium RIFCSPHIGHO2_01_FULL_39_23]OGM64197.1 MAG: hypothetical protein A2961_03565 [Candidatus Woesebacteria bacterium RIFCSPLOWO2_01_FULL_39_21]
MKKYFVETSVIAGFLRGNKKAYGLVANIDELTGSYVSLSELYEGVYRVSDWHKEEESVLKFFSQLSEVYGVDKDISKQFGRIRADLKKKGKVIEDMDIFMAATCMANGLTMITLNKKHFERVPGLEIL